MPVDEGCPDHTVTLVMRQRGGAGLWVLLALALAAVGFAWWRFFPDSLPTTVRQVTPPSPTSSPVLYKWRDAKGNLNYTDTPPADRPFEKVQIDPNTNVLPSGVAPEPG